MSETGSNPTTDPNQQGAVLGEFKKVRKRQIVFERFNIRCGIDPSPDLDRLAASIARDGQLHPCYVIPHTKAKNPKGEDLYEGITGSRRRRSLADDDAFLDVRVLPADTPESQLWELAFSENESRKPLNFIERTITFTNLFDARAYETIPGYRQLSEDRDQRARACRNLILDRANSKRASKDPALVAQLIELYDELKAIMPKRVEAKTFFPRHLRVLDLPKEILRDVAWLPQQDVVRIATAFGGAEGETRQKLIDEIREKSRNEVLTSNDIRCLVNWTKPTPRRKRAVTRRFRSEKRIDDHSTLYESKEGRFVLIKLTDDAAADQQSAATAIAKAHAELASATASTTPTDPEDDDDGPTNGGPDEPPNGGTVGGDQNHDARGIERGAARTITKASPRLASASASEEEADGESDARVTVKLPILISSYAAKSILTKAGGFLKGYTHTLNPAIGCVYGRGFCGLGCYAEQGLAHIFNSDGKDWGDYVKPKDNAPQLLRTELERAARRDPEHPEHVSKITIFMSSSTEPCVNPVLPITRECLQVMQEFPIKKVVVQTRSPHVVQLKDVIEALGSRCVVSFTTETDSAEIWNLGPKGAPGIGVRRRAFEAMEHWSTKKHLAVAPCLKLIDPSAFADWIASTADLATVDTFVSGDGSPDGSRTSRSAIPEFYEQQGWDWKDESQAKELLKLLQERMGDRAAWSSEGFNQLASI